MRAPLFDRKFTIVTMIKEIADKTLIDLRSVRTKLTCISYKLLDSFTSYIHVYVICVSHYFLYLKTQ